jgi:CcmD family protein
MRTILLFTLFFTSTFAHAQGAAPTWLEDSLHAQGKFNAVTIVVGVIILGIGLWMWSMDRKLKRMEERMKK